MGQSTSVRLGAKTCLAANAEYSAAAHLANSFFCPRGRKHGTAHVLMLWQDVAAISNGPQTLTLTCGGVAASFAGLYLNKAVCVSGGPANSPDRAYLCELVDVRFALEKYSDTNRQFNVRTPAAPSTSNAGTDPQEFYADSLNSGAPWDWESLVAALWSDLPAALAGPFPGLPATVIPASPPDGLRYQGVGAWFAVNDVLENLLNCTVVYNPFSGQLGIEPIGAPDPAFGAAVAANPLYLEDADPIDGLALQIPATVRVYFSRQSLAYGTEIDTPRQSNWADKGGLIWIDTPTGAASAVPGTVKRIFAELPALFDFDLTIENLAELEARALQLTTTWLAREFSRLDRFRRTYSGILPAIAPGSQTAWVWWRSDLEGPRTIVGNGPVEFDPFREGTGHRAQGTGFGGGRSENLRPPDWARRTAPIYPRVLQLVQVVSPTKDSDGFYLGNVVQINPAGPFTAGAPFVELEPCLLADLKAGTTRGAGEIHYGRLNGVAESLTGPLPLYVLDSASNALSLLKLTQDIDHNDSGTADLYTGAAGQEVDSGQNVTAFNRFTPLLQGEFALAYQAAGSQVYLIVNDEYQGRLLCKTDADIDNGASGDVTVYAGAQGGEANTGKTITACNRLLAKVRDGQWVWVESDGDGWYIVAAQSGAALFGKVKTGSADPATGYAATDGTANIEIYSSSTNTGVEVLANVEFAPVIDGEWVWTEWDGTYFTIVRGEYDGGALAQTGPATGGGQINKGTFGFVSLYGGTQGAEAVQVVSLQVFNKLGNVPGGKWVWLGRNRAGWYIVSAEC